MYSFVIPHFAQTPKHVAILESCIYFIRRTQPSHDVPIYIIRNTNSTQAITSLDILTDPYIQIHDNPYPDAGEIGALYWVYSNKDKIVTDHVILFHDSMRCIRDMSSLVNTMRRERIDVSFLWFFTRGFAYYYNELKQCFDMMDPTKTIQRLQKFVCTSAGWEWVGCFGSSIIISVERLTFYADHVNLFAPIAIVKSKPYREAYERILGLIFHEHESRFIVANGDIFEQPFMADTESGLENLSFEDLIVKLNDYICTTKPYAIKIFVGR